MEGGATIFIAMFTRHPNRNTTMKLSKAFKKMISTLMAVVVVACGGGSDEPVSPVVAYLGTWGRCDGSGQMDRVLMTQGASATDLQIKQETTLHAKADCSDSAGATLYFSGASTAAVRTGAVSVNLDLPGASARAVTADQFNTVTTGGPVRVVSSGFVVEYFKTSSTRGQWCINGVAGKNYCFFEDDEIMESGEDKTGLYLEINQLYTFQQDEKSGPFTLSGNFKRL